MSTLGELLRYRARTRPGQIALTFLYGGGRDEVSWSYDLLDRKARTVAVLVRDLSGGAEKARGRPVPADQGGRPLVGCGRPIAGQDLAIVDPETSEVRAEGEIGEVWVRGPSLAAGYWLRPEATRQTFGACLDSGGPYLRTGDLGFLLGGELFLTSRIKDLVIVRGANHCPQDVEETVGRSHPDLREGCGAAFSVEADDEERLVVVQELRRESRRPDVAAIFAAVREAVTEEHGVAVWAVVLIRTGSLPKTSSGKIQRSGCREAFLAGELPVVAEWRLEKQKRPRLAPILGTLADSGAIRSVKA